MKRTRGIIVIATILIATVTNIQAQGFYWGPRVGMNISNITKTSYAKSRLRMNFGLHAGYKINDVIGIQLEGLYSLQGAASHNSDEKTTLNYLKVPVLAKIYLIGGLNIEAGVGFNWLLYAQMKGTGTDGNEYSVNLKDKTRAFDFTIPIGLNFQFRRLVDIGVRYDISTTRTPNSNNDRAKNSNWSINLGIRF